MPRKLRSNAEYGNARWATRRALWRALGLTDEDLDKPKIAIVNSSSISRSAIPISTVSPGA